MILFDLTICVEFAVRDEFQVSDKNTFFYLMICVQPTIMKGWLAIAKLKPLSLFISLNIIALESI